MAHTLFISDLHLSADRPDITQCFIHFVQQEATTADALYILGDLFELWLGDDDVNEFSEHIADALLSLSQRIPIYFIHGNRDFAIGERYAKRAGLILLPEQKVIDLYGNKVVILHGDELCTRDIEYMAFRKKARGWWWPKLMKAIPLYFRKKLAKRGRQVSKNNQMRLTEEIMDVTQEEVELTLQRHRVELMIHGHTHRPNVHEFEANKRMYKRIVLGDWYEQGSYLRAEQNDLSLVSKPFD